MPSYPSRLTISPKTTVAVGILAILLIAGGAVLIGTGGPTNLVSLLASLLTTSRERIFFTDTPYDVLEDEVLRLGWEREGIRGSGTFRFTYPCTGDGIGFSFPDGTTVPCTEGAVIAPTSPVEIIPTLAADTPVTIFVSIHFFPENATVPSVTGSVAVTLRPKPAASSARTPSPILNSTPAARGATSTLTPGERTVTTYEFPAGSSVTSTTTLLAPPGPVSNGVADLAASVIDTGTVNANGDAFVSTRTIPKGEHAAIVFDVANIGKGTSARWNFIVNLPTLEPYLFRSETQPALLPGEKIRFTIGFSDIRSGTTTAVITVDPDNSLRDANRENDHATASFYRNPD